MGNSLKSDERRTRQAENEKLLAQGQYQCSKCEVVKPVEDFSMYGAKRPGMPYSQCKECVRNRINSANQTKAAKRQEQYSSQCQLCDGTMKANRKTQSYCCKAHRVFVWQVGQYGGSLRDARRLFKITKCEICGSPHDLCIDHNHATMQWRGRLCQPCNQALGHIRDSSVTAFNMIRYLQNPIPVPIINDAERADQCKWCGETLVNAHPNRKFCSSKCKRRANDVYTTFHLVPEQLRWMFDIQGNRCRCCQEQLDDAFTIDHDHVTGAVRGLLCFNCNIALGLMQDDTDIFAKAIVYLNRPNIRVFHDWSVQRIDKKLAHQIAREKHYLHRTPNVSHSFGLFHASELKGICTFAMPPSRRITLSVCPTDPTSVLELNRLWVADDCPKNTATWFVSRCLKDLPACILISYADTGAYDETNDRYHDGSVYRALSFNFAGKSKASVDYRIPGKTRNVGRNTPGAVAVPVPPKNRYWRLIGDKRERKALASICRWPSLPYQKESPE